MTNPTMADRYQLIARKQEVRRRIKKQEESELKYKELYENILDSLVVLVGIGNAL